MGCGVAEIGGRWRETEIIHNKHSSSQGKKIKKESGDEQCLSLVLAQVAAKS
jgi:hypothetical protein